MAARRSRKKTEPDSVGLEATALRAEPPPAEIAALEAAVDEAGGAVLCSYRDPLGGRWLCLASLPVAVIAPTPFQRDLSETHAARLQDVIARLGSFLDPVIAVPVPDARREDGKTDAERKIRFWTPNGYHRLCALQRMGARSITVLLSPDPALAYRILVLNTEKAHNVKERSLEAMRMACGLAELNPDAPEADYALELEDGSLVTLGFAYTKRPRFAGGAYAPALKASDGFIDEGIAAALALRRKRAERLLSIDDRVAEIVKTLKERGLESPYLKNFVVSRIRPFRPRGKPAPSADALLDHMQKAAAGFDVDKIRGDQIAKAAGSSVD